MNILEIYIDFQNPAFLYYFHQHQICLILRLYRLQMISEQNICYRKQAIKHWLNSIDCKNSELTTLDVARHFCLALWEFEKIKRSRQLNAPKMTINQQIAEEEVDVEQLWKSNQYFYQSLIDFSQDLLHYTYASISSLRNKHPRCLVGYYEITKNIAHFHEFQAENDDPQISKHKLKIEQQKIEYSIPASVKQFCKDKITSLLFGIIPMNELHEILIKYSESPLMKQFYFEIQKLIILRVQYFQAIYGVQFISEANQFIKLTLFSESYNKSEAKESLDQVLLCLIYLIFKVNKQTIIFSKIVNIYEEKSMLTVNKQSLLNYFNNTFLAQWHQKIKNPLLKHVKIEKKMSQKIIGDQIKEQQSIFDMFGS